MRRFFVSSLTFFALLAFIFGSVACGSKVPAGNVGVKVYLTGSSKGVDHEVLSPGRYWIGFNEDLFLFPTFQKTHNWTKATNEGNPVDESFTFQDKNGMSVGADIGISFCYDPKNVSTLFQKFRKGEEEITNTYLRSIVRDALNRQASLHDIEFIYGPTKTQFMTDVTEDVKKQVSPYGIVVEKIMLINELRLPDTIVQALNAKVKATQMAMQIENEKRAAEAQAVKQLAEAEGYAKSQKVRGDADAEYNRKIAASITPTLIEKMRVEKWNGEYPTYMGGGQAPMLTLPMSGGKK